MPKRNFIWLLAILITAAAAVWFSRARQQSRDGQSDGSLALGEAFAQIQNRWHPGTEPEAYRQAVLEKMVELLDDPYSMYIPPQRGEMLNQRILGKQRGVGLLLDRRAGRLEVMATDPLSPAHRAGLIPGDRVIQIGDKQTQTLSSSQAEIFLDGPVGTKHVLSINRKGRDEPFDITLVVEQYPVETVVGLGRDREGNWIHRLGRQDQFVYIHIREFVQDTAGDMHKAVHLGGAKGVILDLRSNPGGLLPVAIDVANMFLRTGLIAEVITRKDPPQQRMAIENGTYPPVPMVVLIDAHSASGAELVAAALGQKGRALIIGQRSRGKGLVQSLISLPDQAGYLYLTTSEFRPAGQSLLPLPGMPGGVEPHEIVTNPAETSQSLARLKQDLGLLPAAGQAQPPSEQTRAEKRDQIIALDKQLAAAIDWLNHPERLEKRLAEIAAANQED